MQKTITLLLFILLSAFTLRGQLPFTFIENKGQWNGDFQYKTSVPGGAMFTEKQGITYNFTDYTELYKAHMGNGNQDHLLIKGHAVKVQFVNSNPNPRIESKDALPQYFNYYYGNDPAKWVAENHPVKKVIYHEVWKDIDLIYYGAGGRIKYDIVVNPGGNYEDIQLNYKGQENIRVENGELIITTSLGSVTEQKPYVYQEVNGERIEIPSAYELNGNKVKFIIRKTYKPNLPLIIDPTLIFASYTGSTADNFGMTATYDSQGHLFTGGTAFDTGFPTTPGAYDNTANPDGFTAGITDVVITKFSPDGSSLVYSTYIGGGTNNNGTETVHSLMVNKNDELFLFGLTSSADFPTTSGCYDSTYAGGSYIYFPQNGTLFNTGTDIFVSKFNYSGTSLLASTYIGGSANDGINNNTNTTIYDSLQFNYGDQFRGEIFIDDSGNCYVASCTHSGDFPIVNGFKTSLSGDEDGVVFKFSPDLSTLIWSTYIGGSGKDACYGLKADDSSNVYVTGGTSSPDFTTTSGAINTSYQGGVSDGYVCKISADGSTLLHSTFIGTDLYDQSFFVELDADYDVYIYGQTKHPSVYPVMNANYVNPNSGQFITKMDSTLSTIIYSSVFGNTTGAVNISPSAFLVDICENVYISGWGASILGNSPLNSMPITPNAHQSSAGDGFNFYLAVFSTDFDSLVYATYFGGTLSREHVDGGTSRFDKNGVIYQSVCAGCGSHDDFPTTPGAWSNTNNSANCNNGVFKLDIELPFTIAGFDYPQDLCMNYAYQFLNQSNGADVFIWDFGDGSDTSSVRDPYHAFTNPGTYTITLIAIDTSFRTCIAYDTIAHVINIIDDATVSTLTDITICNGEYTPIGILPQPGMTYSWTPTTSLSNPSVSNPIATPSATTDYLLLADDGVCIDSIFQTVIVDPNIPVPGFNIHASGTCSNVILSFTSTATNSSNVIYIVNGDTLAPGDTLTTAGFGQTLSIVQIAFNTACSASLSQNFTTGNFSDYNDTLTMPNVFTPFASIGINDYFCPINTNGEYCYEMIIYNRWGRSVYESSSDAPCWDGYINNTTNRAVDGVYFWILRYGGTETAGFLHLISTQN